MQTIRIYDFPQCKMVSSGIGMFGEEKFERFIDWMSAQPAGLYPKDFLFFDSRDGQEGFHWLYAWDAGMEVPAEFECIDFWGGLYAAATGIDQQTDMDALNAEVDAFLVAHGLERDPSRPDLGNVLTSPQAGEILGYEQMDYLTPVRHKA